MISFVRSLKFNSAAAYAAASLALALPDAARACACGCGVFDVATSSMLPQGPGGMAYLEYDYQNQDRNWSGSGTAPAGDNPDKDLRTDFVTAGLQYMFNRSWGAQVEVPYDTRDFTTTGGPTGGDIVSLNWSTLGDIRVEGIYTGFSSDLSSGVTFGLKLPTGSYTHNDAYGDVDRDSELGTGSTDALLGGFYRHLFANRPEWTWFAQGMYDQPLLTRDQYRPGAEFDGAAGLIYSGWSAGKATVSPVAQAIVSDRARDSGSNAANPVASGYRRLLLSPGVEVHVHPFSIYADVEFPVYQHFTGDQLAAPALFKVIVAYMF